MMYSTKPEVHNISQRLRRRTEPQKLVKIALVVPEIFSRIDTHRHTDVQQCSHNTSRLRTVVAPW